MRTSDMNEALKRKRKTLLVLPLLVLPFLTGLFWALGGGRGDQDKRETAVAGLNLNVPDAAIKENEHADKLSFYDLAEKDSLKFGNTRSLEDLVNSASYSDTVTTTHNPGQNIMEEKRSAGFNSSLNIGKERGLDEAVMNKLSAINALVNNQQNDENISPNMRSEKSKAADKDIERLEQMMQYMNGREPGDDPEIRQLENTLDKLLDVQHPDRVRKQLEQKSSDKKGKIFPIVSKLADHDNSLIKQKGIEAESRFYGIEPPETGNQSHISMRAVVHESQEIVNGSMLKLRSLQAIFINGILIPAGHFIYGLVTFSDERAVLEINSIRYKNNLLAVKLDAYDADGMQGIYMPGLLSREVSKQAADNSLQMMELSSLDPSIKAQVATAGIQAAKSLAGKKTKIIRVKIKAGYELYLKDKTTDQ